MGNSRLPADNLWTQYKNNCERIFQEVTAAFNENLTNIARETAFYLDESVKNNIWLRRLDWTPVDLSVRKDAQTLMVSFRFLTPLVNSWELAFRIHFFCDLKIPDRVFRF